MRAVEAGSDESPAGEGLVLLPPRPDPAWRRAARELQPTARYLLSLESHVYAFAVSAAACLSFFPFTVLLLSLTENVLRWRGAAAVIYVALLDALPEDPGLVEFVTRNLRAAVASRGRVEALSALMLIFSSNGVFVPLEVAFNRLWGFASDRSYWLNQALSLWLAFACGGLALCGAAAAAWASALLQGWVGGALLPATVKWLAVKLAGVPFTAAALLLVYGLLPNGRVPLRTVARLALLMALVLEAGRYAYLWLWPLLGLRRAYGPFFISVTVLIGGYVAAMILLGGVHLAVRADPDHSRGRVSFRVNDPLQSRQRAIDGSEEE